MESLGINIVNLIINVILFIVFFSILHNLVLKKLSGVLEQRKAAIDIGLQNAESSKELLSKAQKDFEDIKKKAEDESDSIMKEARKLSEIESKKLLVEVEAEATQIREKSNALLATHKQKLEQEFDARVEKAVRSSLEKIFRDNPDFRL